MHYCLNKKIVILHLNNDHIIGRCGIKHYYIIRRVRISPITNNILFLTEKQN